MKRQVWLVQILLALFLTISVGNYIAMCSPYKISVYPNTKTICANSIFIIEGYSSSQSVIGNLNNGNAIYLTSGSDTVLLKVVKTLKGQYELTQAILKPLSDLISGKHYKLNIDNLTEYEKSDFERDSIGWTVTEFADLQKPVWLKEPIYRSKRLAFYGCGPAEYVNFCACISDYSPVVIYAKVKNLKTKSVCDYYITPDSCSFQIGHGMCSGEFIFERGQGYEATFSLMDASGNISTESHILKFISPSKVHEGELIGKELNCDCSDQKNGGKETVFWMVIIFAAVGLIMFLRLWLRSKRKKNLFLDN